MLQNSDFWFASVLVKMLGAFFHVTNEAIIAFLCHFTGCAWYALGREEVGNSWITVHEATRAFEQIEK